MEMLRAVSILSLLVTVLSYKTQHVSEMQMKNVIRFNGGGQFSWSSCNKSAPIQVTGMTVSPDPVILGQMATVSIDVTLTEDIGTSGEIDDDMDIQMKIGTKYEHMCDLIGDEICHGKDVCKMLKTYIPKCPEFIQKQGSNCQCPFKKNAYSFKNIPIPLPTAPISISGEFKDEIHLVQNGRQLMCLDVTFCITNCE